MIDSSAGLGGRSEQEIASIISNTRVIDEAFSRLSVVIPAPDSVDMVKVYPH
ncbi:hypothetical protein D515_01092 [Grimontia indica]|uniref:Uncharacterized protein n=1 Tax=Grimontia indica TaxID=1056512 RepID=R1GUY4_9GAMM|nr:hypothetical protein D515_01092 [Grimontia indica]